MKTAVGRGALAPPPSEPLCGRGLSAPSLALQPCGTVMSLDDDTSDKQGDALTGAAGATVTIIVCETCRDAAGSDAEPRPGVLLAEATRAAAEGTDVRVHQVACLGNCSRRLSAAMIRDGAWSYVFGDLDVTSGPHLVEGARLFATAADGIMPWRGRPACLKRGLVARVPPLDLLEETE